MKKTVWTLIVDNYSPQVTALTLPHMRTWAKKIGADFRVINERMFPGWPPAYEKLQLYELGRNSDWNIFFDADSLIHPDLFDMTEHISKDTVLHWWHDLAGSRWRYDNYFRRDGRHIGSGNWFAVASNWCLDLWKPLDDLTLAEAVQNITVTAAEKTFGLSPEHLIDDYTLSRNIAKYGLHFRNFNQILNDLGRQHEAYFFHNYLLTEEKKLEHIKGNIELWKLE